MNGVPMKFRKIISIAFIACCLSWQNAPSLAYERDVHYGLTKWLALKAGFAPTVRLKHTGRFTLHFHGDDGSHFEVAVFEVR